jgi:glycosyltransferase involved in cell wall biosynthesis
MPEILFLHKGRHAASTRYRALQYFDGLSDAGWRPREMKVSGSVSQYFAAIKAARKADVVVVLKKPFRPIFRWFLRRVTRKLVFDFDDAIYVRDSGEPNPRRYSQFRKMILQCDDVWAGNAQLLSTAAPFAKRSCLVPTTLPQARYLQEPVKPTGSIDLVWIGGSASRPWLESIFSVLERAALQIPGLRLKIIADFALESSVLEVLAVPWSDAGEAQALADAHIGIAPLPDNAFTRGKCGLKTLQYMAAGLPVIASSTVVQSDMVIPGRTGFLADSESAWLDALQQLATDEELRNKMGQTGRTMCALHYSIETGCAKILQRLDTLKMQ